MRENCQKLNSGFMIAHIFSEKCSTTDILLSSFFDYLHADDVDMLKPAIAKVTIYLEEGSKDVLKILSFLNLQRIPKTGTDLHTIRYKIGHKEVVQKQC